METVMEFLWHASGFCGEHWHPNAINLSVIGLVVWSAVRLVRSGLARFARIEGTN
jgi:hypothetical protein